MDHQGSPHLHFKDGETEAKRKLLYVGQPRIQIQIGSSSKVCPSGPITPWHILEGMHRFHVILDYLQESFIHQEGPWGKKGNDS